MLLMEVLDCCPIRPDQFLPVGWPTYYTKAKNCFIWGSEGQKFIDFSLMGVGTIYIGVF